MRLSEHIPEDHRGLIDDRGERDAIDDPVHAVRPGMIECEAERRKRFASAGRHVEREYAPR